MNTIETMLHDGCYGMSRDEFEKLKDNIINLVSQTKFTSKEYTEDTPEESGG